MGDDKKITSLWDVITGEVGGHLAMGSIFSPFFTPFFL